MRNYVTNLYEYTEQSTGKHVVKATTTYAGKSVYAFAKCAPEDKFDPEFGTRLALKRLDLKIAQKRTSSMLAQAKRCQKAINYLEQEKRRMKKLRTNAEIAALDRKLEIKELEAELAEMLNNI